MMFAILMAIALKSVIVLATAHLLAWSLRGRSAALRHILWTSAGAALLILPLLSISLPVLRVRGVPSGSALFQITGLASNDSAAGPFSVPSAVGVVRHAGFHPDWRNIAVWVWAAGAVLLLAQMSVAYARLSMLRRRARLIEYRGSVRVLQTVHGTMPMTFGVLRPTILLPAGFEHWDPERRRLVLLHEMAHLERGDAATQLLARIALSLYWWNPLAWSAWKHFVKERECAADDLVLAAGTDAPGYAEHLLAVARAMQPVDAWAAVTMARCSQLEGRLRAILRSNADRHAPRRAAVFAGVLLSTAAIAPLAALRAQQSAPQSSIQAAIATFQAKGQYDQSEQLLQQSLKACEQNAATPEELVKLGQLAEEFGKNAQAHTCFTSAVALGDRPEVAPALLNLAVEAYAKKDQKQAEKLLQRAEAVSKSPDLSGPILTWKAVIQGGSQAGDVLRQALSAEDSNSPQAALTMEIYAHELPNVGDAAEMASRASAIRTNHIAELSPKRPDSTPAQKSGGGVEPPKILYKAAPAYSVSGKATRTQGTTVLSVVVGTDGRAYDAELVRSVGMGLDEAALTAIAQWRFQPGTENGVPVPVRATIQVNFTLR